MTQPATIEQTLQLALQHHQAGRIADADSLYRRILAAQPNHPDALHLLGALQLDAGNTNEARDLISSAITVNPSAAVYHGNLGLTLARLDRIDDAIASYQKALSLTNGNFPDAWFNLGNALRDQGDLGAALDAYQNAIRLQPGHLRAMNNLGNVLHLLGWLEEAIAMHRHVLAQAPNWALAHYNLGITLMFQGDFENGWREYEYRLGASELDLPRFEFKRPRWDGSELNGKRILLSSDQGFGDALLAVRYVPMVRQRGAGEVIVVCQPQLRRLFEGIAEIDRVVTSIDPTLSYDVHSPLMSMPFLFRTTMQTIPIALPYLRCEESLCSRWRERFASLGAGLKVGLAYAGRKYPPGRSIPLSLLADHLGALGGMHLISLQKGTAPAEPDEASRRLRLIDWTAEIHDFADTAALIDSLDLVITVDTVVAHLAGAMAKPVWTLLQRVPDWRWLMDRGDSPWYPTMRLFRQSIAGDWKPVLASVASALQLIPDA